jgi:two-component system response regulator YesN
MREESPINLLIVEDERLTLLGLQRGIDWAGLGVKQVFAAEDGERALEICGEHLVRIVITDIRMPGIDGLELGQRLQCLYGPIKIIYLTAHADFQYVQRALRLGAEDYLLKPVNIEKLCTRVRDAIRELRTEGQGGSRPAETLGPGQNLPGVAAHDKMFYGDPVIKNSHDGFTLSILTAVDHIQLNYAKPLEIQSMAALTGLTDNYFSQKFKQETGASFSHYVNCVRVNQAKQMLAHTTYKFYEISALVGYSDYRYFSTVFKKLTGLTLSEYRDRPGVS